MKKIYCQQSALQDMPQGALQTKKIDASTNWLFREKNEGALGRGNVGK